MAKKASGSFSSPMNTIFPKPSPTELAGGTDRMDGEFSQAPASGVIKNVIYTGHSAKPAPLNTPFGHAVAKRKK